jgi:P-type E1-E2 ATPase
MGDGINDASALHAADAGISVDTAADVVKEAADFVLLEKDLKVLAKGVEEGRFCKRVFLENMLLSLTYLCVMLESLADITYWY